MGVRKGIEQSPKKTTLLLKVPSQKKEEELSSISDITQKQVTENSVSKNLRETLFSTLKIIVIATFADDDTSDDFFSDFGNYMSIAKRLKEMNLLSDDVSMDENVFNNNPPDCWMKILITIFVSLYSFPDNSGIYCDIITSADVENNSQRTPIGTYFSTILRLEAYDWNEHKVDVYIPNKNGERMLFLIDDEPVLYTLIHSTSQYPRRGRC